MTVLKIARGNCDPIYFDCVRAGTNWDFAVTGEALFPSDTVQASTWIAVSGCTVSNVVVDDSKTLSDGNTYANVVTARIGGLSAGIEAVTTLTFRGDLTAQDYPCDIRIPVAT